MSKELVVINIIMYVILNYNIPGEYSEIEGIVETYDILVSYMNALVAKNPTLKWCQAIPRNSGIGYKVPILFNETDEYLIARHEFVAADHM